MEMTTWSSVSSGLCILKTIFFAYFKKDIKTIQRVTTKILCNLIVIVKCRDSSNI